MTPGMEHDVNTPYCGCSLVNTQILIGNQDFSRFAMSQDHILGKFPLEPHYISN